MPLIRRIGNMGLAFLAKAATGYWNLFDPTNGFLAIRGEMLAQLPLDQIDHGYFFETSMLANLYLLGAVVQDVPMPARYKGEVSSLLIHRVLFEFPPKLFVTLCRRAVLKNFIYDFSMISYLSSDRPASAALRPDLWGPQMDPICPARDPRADRHRDPADAMRPAGHSTAALGH